MSGDSTSGGAPERRRTRVMGAGWLLLIAAWTASRDAQERVAFRHLTIADGLSQNVVSAIVHDRRGFMWFGTRGSGLP